MDVLHSAHRGVIELEIIQTSETSLRFIISALDNES